MYEIIISDDTDHGDGKGSIIGYAAITRGPKKDDPYNEGRNCYDFVFVARWEKDKQYKAGVFVTEDLPGYFLSYMTSGDYTEPCTEFEIAAASLLVDKVDAMVPGTAPKISRKKVDMDLPVGRVTATRGGGWGNNGYVQIVNPLRQIDGNDPGHVVPARRAINIPDEVPMVDWNVPAEVAPQAAQENAGAIRPGQVVNVPPPAEVYYNAQAARQAVAQIGAHNQYLNQLHQQALAMQAGGAPGDVPRAERAPRPRQVARDPGFELADF